MEKKVQYYQEAARYMGELSKQDSWHRRNRKDMAPGKRTDTLPAF